MVSGHFPGMVSTHLPDRRIMERNGGWKRDGNMHMGFNGRIGVWVSAFWEGNLVFVMVS